MPFGVYIGIFVFGRGDCEQGNGTLWARKDPGIGRLAR
jgi:hypothetical protein